MRALAIDFDGTLTDGTRPEPPVLEAVDALGGLGIRRILVTGRIIGELRRVFPEVDRYFDCIVGENGGVLTGSRGRRTLANPVDQTLEVALVHRGVRVHRGEVLLESDGHHDALVLEEIRRLGLDCQIMRNRGALMVLPAGVTKASGLRAALDDLGISRHNTVAVGDAENDRSMLECVEFGVAVANAVPSLKERADRVMEEADGAGTVALLESDVWTGLGPVSPTRWRLDLGTDDGGHAVQVPASRFNLLIAGGTGSGKSYVAGLAAEQVTRMGYSAVIIDPEGDHRGLGQPLGVITVGGVEPLSHPADIELLLRGGTGTVVVDLSALPPSEHLSYVNSILPVIEQMRTMHGSPQWIMVDEAHRFVGDGSVLPDLLCTDVRGFCLVSYRPQELIHLGPGAFDAVVVMPGLGPEEETAIESIIAEQRGAAPEEIEHLRSDALIDRMDGTAPSHFTIAERHTAHQRHWHKYVRKELAPDMWFTFRGSDGLPTGHVARSVDDFHRELHRCEDDVVVHHATNQDFSRWLGDVTRDSRLHDAVARCELGAAGPIRQAVLRMIEHQDIGGSPISGADHRRAGSDDVAASEPDDAEADSVREPTGARDLTSASSIDRASAEDVVSLATDVGPTPMQVGAVIVLDVGDRPLDTGSATAVINERIRSVPRLRQRLRHTATGGGRPVWVDDDQFDIVNHVTRTTCGAPGDDRSLLDLAGSIITRPLPRERPLWSMVIVEGLTEDRVALVISFHHVLADGIGGLAVLAALVDGAHVASTAPFPRPAPHPRELRDEHLRSILRVVSTAPAHARRVMSAARALRPASAEPPARCSLNRPTTGHRHLRVVRVPLAQIREVGHAHDATVNDVLVAAVGAALGTLVSRRGETIDAVVMSVPVAARRSAAATSLGNEVGAVPVRIPVHGDLRERLDATSSATRAAKSGPPGSTSALLGPLFRLLAALRVFRWFIDHQRLVHTFVTNLHGPDQPLSMFGATVREVSAVALVPGNVTVSFAALSYAGTLAVTIIADPNTCPDLDTLEGLLETELRRSG